MWIVNSKGSFIIALSQLESIYSLDLSLEISSIFKSFIELLLPWIGLLLGFEHSIELFQAKPQLLLVLHIVGFL